MSEEQNNMYQNLLVVLKLFQNRPHHLTKFLIDNDAMCPDFLSKISDSDKLSDMARDGIKDNHLHFNTISDMQNYYNSLVDDLENLKRKKTPEELLVELQEKLRIAIDNEDFEEACRIRDYMKINNIK